MSSGFDLRDEPWIPVRLAGSQLRVGLRRLFQQAHEIEDLELPVPAAASALLRVLAALTARIGQHDGVPLGDQSLTEMSSREWGRHRDRVLGEQQFDPAAVDAYFDASGWQGRFDLFDDQRPFLQDPRLRVECVDAQGRPNPSGVNKLVLGRPTGVNGAVLFGHFTDTAPVPVPAAEAAWHLLAQLYYGPSGQCTPRRITADKPGNGDAGPLRKTVSFHPWAPRLFTTLVLGVPAPGDEPDADRPDLCPWEEEQLPDPLGPLAPPTWPTRLLTGRFRHAVLLVPSADRRTVTDAYVTWSTHQPPSAAADPYVIRDMPRKGDTPFARPADGRRALWRDLDALLLRTGDRQAQRPRILDSLPSRLRQELRVRAYGFDQDGQQRDNGWYEATTPPVLRWQREVHPEMAYYVDRCHQFAEQVGDRLDFAARLAWRLTTEPPKDPAAKVKLDRKKPGPWRDVAMRHFWPEAERVFWQLVTPEQCDASPERPFVSAALDALDGAIGTAARADVRVARARSRARAALFALLPSTAEQ
ncbi:type I-E CRISPR-associated protein Cse1/CasA [Kitasatospora sp. NPDC058965]|uniref:type I-E CRISPR-associated protein Cse1/CasA n=1 Tax=Kitasatospora sp. NPDC058965 TaxID=3346682 RepID=UPI003676EFF4